MLEIVVPETEFFNERTSKLIRVKSETLRLEHSLSSMSKWEQNWEIPFFSKTTKTLEQMLGYIKCMSAEPISDQTLSLLSEVELDQLNVYLNSKRSATWFSDEASKTDSNQTVTAELIYYWMSALNIPFTCDVWPLPFLMNTIKIAQIKSDAGQKKKGHSRTQMLSERAALNAKRRSESNSKG